MGHRIHSPDTQADISLRKALDDDKSTGFTVIAGAGSGKTTSLVKALAYVVENQGKEFLANGQQAACITYTEVAAREVQDELMGNEAVHVSTIHSFLWGIIRPFQRNIRLWVEAEIQVRLTKAIEEQASFSSRVQQKRREATEKKIQKLTGAKPSLDRISRFNYGVASDFRNGVLGHEDITRMVSALIIKNPLLATVVARRYPVIFVDESQDTLPEVVDCLRHIAKQHKTGFCLGFFGDPMQKIYVRGIGEIPLDDGWLKIEKPENFRSPTRVLDVINAVRQDGDGLKQVSGLPESTRISGEVTFFVLPRDLDRRETITRVQSWLAEHSSIGAWAESGIRDSTKILVIAHRMAARRLGFEALYDVFHGSQLQDAFDEGRAWPLAPFVSTLIPLYRAAKEYRAKLVPILRHSSPILREGNLVGAEMKTRLQTLSIGVDELVRTIEVGGPGSIGHVLRIADEYKLLELEPRMSRFFSPHLTSLDSDLSDQITTVVRRFLESDIAELSGYFNYIDRESPYSTQQGVKGAEYPDVLVVLDDEEGRHNQFSYDKLFGVKALSQKDRENQLEGRETIVDRTRRLLYVCASRSTRALAIVFYADEVDVAFAVLSKSGLPGSKFSKRWADLSS